MTDTERVLRVLIHDARTPIGVAQGYVRLLREERLQTPEERERALSRAMDALGRIARLCDDASGFLASPNPEAPTTTIGASVLASLVEACIREARQSVHRKPIDAGLRVRIGTSGERLAEAIAHVLLSIRPAAGESAPRFYIDVDTGTGTLRLLAMPDDRQPPAAGDAALAPFDGWLAGGLIVPLACRVVEETGGRLAQSGPAIVVTFPVEAPA
jgi:signal transduction histidine kinase